MLISIDSNSVLLLKVFLPHSIYSICLDGIDDPFKSGYSASTIFRITNPNNLITLEELHSILSKTRDIENIKVPFEIFLTQSDSDHFTVAARIKTPRGNRTSIFNPGHMHQLVELLEMNGNYIRQSLEKHFPKECITSLQEEDLKKDLSLDDCRVQGDEAASRISSFVAGVFDTLGLSWLYSAEHNGCSGVDEGIQRGKKRRRTD
jgi:hypothetical protein